MVQHLPIMHLALGSIPSTIQFLFLFCTGNGAQDDLVLDRQGGATELKPQPALSKCSSMTWSYSSTVQSVVHLSLRRELRDSRRSWERTALVQGSSAARQEEHRVWNYQQLLATPLTKETLLTPSTD